MTPIHLLFFGGLLAFFHPIQVVALRFGGFQLQKPVVEILNYLLIRTIWLLASTVRLRAPKNLPVDRPVIIVSNHQSMYDIPAVVWMFKKIAPRFVSKVELAKGIPSISIYLRGAQSALIDRKDKQQAIREIERVGQLIQTENCGVCIFPEGTRSRDGLVRPFKTGGIEALLQQAPNAVIWPLAIIGNNQLHQYGKYPMGVGHKMEYKALDPVEPDLNNIPLTVKQVEHLIREALGQSKPSTA